MRKSFGADAPEPQGGIYSLNPTTYRPPASGRYAIEPDLSAASYLLALTLIHSGRLTLPNLGKSPLQGDAGFAEILARHGLRVARGEQSWEVTMPGRLDGVSAERTIDFSNISDTFLTYAAIAPLLGGKLTVEGIGHTRHQETDRVAGMATELAKLGQGVQETTSTLTITPNLDEMRNRAQAARSEGGLLTVETYEDHRFAMSFGVLGSTDLLGDGKPWLAIADPSCCGKTYPQFFEVLQSLRDE